MKILLMSLFLFSLNAHASGCSPYDVYLVKEELISSVGEHSGYFKCEDKSCWIETGRLMNGASEIHNLVQAVSTDKPVDSTQIFLPSIELQIYRQTFSSSCSGIVRYVIGTNFKQNGKEERYRSEVDPAYL